MSLRRWNVTVRGPIPENWDEYDAFSRWRHYISGMDRAGVRAKMKRQYNRRVRRTWRPEDD